MMQRYSLEVSVDGTARSRKEHIDLPFLLFSLFSFSSSLLLAFGAAFEYPSDNLALIAFGRH
jgi:hypothetical protein